MTTKYKIIVGFALMILLLAGIAGLGVYDLQLSSDGFIDYRRQAQVNVVTSDMQVSLSNAVSYSYDFANTFDDKSMDEADKSAAAFEKACDAAMETTHIQYRKDTFADMRRRMEPFKAALTSTRASLNQIRKQYEGVVRPAVDGTRAQLEQLGEMSLKAGNINSLYSTAQANSSVAAALSPLARFAQSFTEADARLVRERLNSANTVLERLGGELHTEGGIRLYQSISDSWKKLNAAFADMEQQGRMVRKGLDDLRAMSQSIPAALKEFNARVDGEMRAAGEAMLESNSSAQKMMAALSGAGMLLGILLAGFCIFGIIRVLSDLSHFAEAIAEGDFHYEIKTREKGEIGAMLAAMRAIPQVLQSIIDAGAAMAEKLRTGSMRERLEAKAFPGSYGNLVASVNTIADAYTAMLDVLPLPLMACDNNMNIRYLNKTGQGALGGDYKDQCSQHLKAGECGGNMCFGRRVMTEDKVISGETKVYPRGVEMHVSVTAVPLKNSKNQISGYFEVLTDLTAIRAQQTTMMEVARQASDIAGRVAAASEELSSQVEEVSRGAEMQRARVESTASSMSEMTSTVLEVARNAGRASEQSDMTRQKASDGSALVSRVVSSINQVNSAATALQKNMQELGGQAENIGGVMNVISDIADQTNLLALNAAIEAARAGEAGRGFAVVADEVRKLAEKTMNATREVGANITAIQQSARTNIEEMASAAKSVTEATTIANESGAALHEILELATSNSTVVASIATAAEEQSATSEEINRAIDEINKIVGETSQGMFQSAKAVQDLSRTAQELNGVMARLK